MAKKTTDPCERQRARVEECEESIREMQDRLPDTPPSKRRKLEEEIRKAKLKLTELKKKLRECLAAH